MSARCVRAAVFRRSLGGILAGFLAALASAGACAPGPRVASLNLCTDQLLLSLADPEQIVGLSPFVRAGARSWAAERAQPYRVLSGTGEEVVVLKPDLVLAGRPMPRATRDLLVGTGFRVEEFDVVRSIDEAKAQIRRAGDLVGQPARAAALVEAIDAALARTRRAASARPLTVLSLQRRGWVAGGDTLISSLFAAIGLANAAVALGLDAGGFLPLEAVVKAKPDLLLLTRGDDSAEDQGQAMLLHPAIARLYPPERRIVVPERLTVCGGPMIAEALDRLTAELERVAR